MMIDRPKVERWLQETGVDVTEAADSAEADEGFRWHVVFKGGAFSTVVACRDVDWVQLQFQVTINVSEDHRDLIASLDPDTRDRFMFDLRIALLQQQVMYRIDSPAEGSHKGIPERLTFALTAYEESLTKAGFLRRNHRLQNVALLTVQMVQKLARFKDW